MSSFVAENERTGLVARIKWNFKLPDNQSTINCCPYCGSDEFYRKLTFSGRSECNYRFDGDETDNSSIHDGVNYHEQKTVFCRGCNKKLGVEK